MEPAEVVRRAPQIVLASWCGKPVDLEAIRCRPGWEGLPAVREGRVYAVPAGDILAPGPSLLRGLRTLHDVIQAWVAGQSFENGISYKGLNT